MKFTPRTLLATGLMAALAVLGSACTPNPPAPLPSTGYAVTDDGTAAQPVTTLYDDAGHAVRTLDGYAALQLDGGPRATLFLRKGGPDSTQYVSYDTDTASFQNPVSLSAGFDPRSGDLRWSWTSSVRSQKAASGWDNFLVPDGSRIPVDRVGATCRVLDWVDQGSTHLKACPFGATDSFVFVSPGGPIFKFYGDGQTILDAAVSPDRNDAVVTVRNACGSNVAMVHKDSLQLMLIDGEQRGWTADGKAVFVTTKDCTPSGSPVHHEIRLVSPDGHSARLLSLPSERSTVTRFARS